MQGQQIEDPMTAPMRPLRPISREDRDDDDDSDDGSRPPPEPSTRSMGDRMPSNADWAVQRAGEAKTTASSALKLGTEARDTGRRIEAMMGRSPNPVLGEVGTGLFGVVATIKADVHALTTTVGTLVSALTAQQASAAQQATARSSRAWVIAGWVLGPIGAIVVTALAAYVAGFHR